jgi:hypothetical protein
MASPATAEPILRKHAVARNLILEPSLSAERLGGIEEGDAGRG